MALNISLSLFLIVAVIYAIIFKVESSFWKRNCKMLAKDYVEIYNFNKEVVKNDKEIIDTSNNVLEYANQIMEHNKKLVAIIEGEHGIEN